MGGNVRDWCADGYLAGGPPVTGERVEVRPTEGLPYRVVRGGSWGSGARTLRVCSRVGFPTSFRSGIGVRLGYPVR